MTRLVSARMPSTPPTAARGASPARDASWWRVIAAFLPLAFQNPHDRNYCVPIPCRHRYAAQFVDPAKVADRFHVTTVHSEDESVFRRDNSQQPLPTWRKCDRHGSPDAAGFRLDAHEANNIRARRLTSKRVVRLQTDKIAAVAEHDVRFEWQLPEQFSAELCSRSRFANDKRARSSHIHDIIVAQFLCEDAWAKRPVPANIDTPEENNESHTGGEPYFPNRSNRYASSGPSSPSYASWAISSVNGSV